MQWTRAQRETIEIRDRNILVSAAAGSGKTTVLIERIKQLVLRDHTDIDRFLITTFTKAAAAEMKERLERAIHAQIRELEAEAEPAGEAQDSIAFLRRQLQLLPQANISTFHTFAISIMREYFFLTDLEPGFLIGDETQLGIMLEESMDQVFEERFETDVTAFTAFLRNYSNDRSERRLKEQIKKLYQQMRSIPGYMDWAAGRVRALGTENPVHALNIDGFLLEESTEALEDALHWFDEAARRLDTQQTGSLFLKARQDADGIRDLRDLAREARKRYRQDRVPEAAEEALLQLRERLRAIKWNQMRASGAEGAAFTPIKEEIGWLRDQGKKILDRLKKTYYSQSLEECRDVLTSLEADTGIFLSLIRDLEDAYRQKKQAQNLVDFDDCMHYALKILEDEKAAAQYRQRFRYIFIDEYQDSNQLQEDIIGRICREDNLFMVGDVKQSIYKFRLAEPEIFRRRYDAYRSGEDPHSVRIDLNSNFRSRFNIREAVNRIFETIMEGYDEDASLKGPDPAPQERRYPVSLHVLSRKAGEEDQPLEDGKAQDAISELEIIARVIRDSLGSTITGRDGKERPVTYDDIAVLSRGTAMISRIERYLNNEGIPAFGETGGGYYETVEIQVFVHLLKVVSNLHRDVPLISAMSSVVFDFSPAELARIRSDFPDGSFSSAVLRYEEGGSEESIRRKIRGMLEQIFQWKEIARILPLDELMRRMLYDTGYYDYCSGLPSGQQRTSNLRLLLDKAAAYEERSYLGLFGFLEYVDNMKKSDQKVSEAQLVGEGRNVVHVMTVHKSKGLEFPVVILAGAGRKISTASEGRAPAMHKDLGIGLPQVRRDLHWERRTILQKAIAGQKRREELEEEIRILYVALTRPMERLIIVGETSDAAKLQPFAGKGSFLEMIYGSMCRMAEEDPALAEVRIHQPFERLDHPNPGNAEDGAGREDLPVVEAGGEDLPAAGAGGNAAGGEKKAPLDMEEIHRRLAYRYPYAWEQAVRSKYSVTELSKKGRDAALQWEADGKRSLPQIREAKEIGRMDQQRQLSPAQIGSAMHAVMERIDFARALEEGLAYIEERTGQLHEEGFLTDAEYAAVDGENIDAFFRTPLGARAAMADTLCREKEFLLRKEIDGVPAVVQGIIDCYFEDEDGLVIVDYKNSWAGSAVEEEEVIRRYGSQVALYREALQLALQRPVDEAWLYLFRSRKLLRVD